MKKILSTICLSLIFSLLTCSLVFAQTNTASGQGGTTDSAGQVTSGQLFHKFEYLPQGNMDNSNTDATANTKLGAVQQLPDKDWKTTLASIITILLNISGGLALVSFTVGGAIMIFGSHTPEVLERGKKILIFSVIGLLVIAVSYAIVYGISQLEFFTAVS